MHVRGRTGGSKPWLKLSPPCHAMPPSLSGCTAMLTSIRVPPKRSA